MAEIVLPSLYPKQRAIFYDDARTVVCEATTKAGKSVGGLAWLLDGAFTWLDGRAALWLSPVHPQAKVMFSRVERWLMEADPTKSIWDVNRTDCWIEAGSSRIWFKGSERFDSIYGSDYGAVVMDEASRHREEAWPAVRSTTTATGGKVRIIGNVRGRRNWAYRLARRAESGEPGMAYHRLTCADAVAAGLYSDAEIEDARRSLPEHVFRELYLAEASDDGANPFGMDSIAACTTGLSDGEPVAFGIDLAKSTDWTVVVGLDGSGSVCLLERWQGPWSSTIDRIAGIVGERQALVDATGVGDPIVESLQADIPNVEGFVFSARSKQQIMEGLAKAIQGREIGFPDGWLRNELEAFEYEYGRTHVRYSAPEGMHDDGVCALALAVEQRRCGARNAFTFRVI